MTNTEFDAATPLERNTAVAVALGWQLQPATEPDAACMWAIPALWLIPPGPQRQYHPPAVMTPPNWQGDNAKAFRDIFCGYLRPFCRKHNFDGLCIDVSLDGAIWCYAQDLPHDRSAFFAHADTCAHAICKALLRAVDVDSAAVDSAAQVVPSSAANSPAVAQAGSQSATQASTADVPTQSSNVNTQSSV